MLFLPHFLHPLTELDHRQTGKGAQSEPAHPLDNLAHVLGGQGGLRKPKKLPISHPSANVSSKVPGHHRLESRSSHEPVDSMATVMTHMLAAAPAYAHSFCLTDDE